MGLFMAVILGGVKLQARIYLLHEGFAPFKVRNIALDQGNSTGTQAATSLLELRRRSCSVVGQDKFGPSYSKALGECLSNGAS